jgi:cytochrome o ubiquinol oxidase operon protein cyoD
MNIAQQGVLDPRGPIAAAERLILINASAIMLVVVPVIVLAIAQMGVHLVFFLHIGTGPDNTNNVLALAFGVLIVVLAVSGSLWIMAHLNANMLAPAAIMQMQR